MAKKSKFDTWFVQQFGKRRNITHGFDSFGKLSDQQLRDKVEDAKIATMILNSRYRYDAEYKAARYAYEFGREKTK